jgi:hypothetical protein
MTTTQTSTPVARIFVHTGEGLERIVFGQNRDKAKAAVLAAMVETAKKHHPDAVVKDVVFPEIMSSETNAVRFVMAEFSQVKDSGDTVFCLATFSRNVLDGVLDAVIRTGYAPQFVLCLHKEGDTPAVEEYRLDEKYQLIDWPYGVLYAFLDDDELEKLDMKVVEV